MIIITRPNVTDAEIDHIRERIESVGMRTHLSRGEQRTIIGCIGDEALLQEVPLRSLPGVESVTPVLKPYKLASREFAADRTVVRVGGRDATASFATSAPSSEGSHLKSPWIARAQGSISNLLPLKRWPCCGS